MKIKADTHDGEVVLEGTVHSWGERKEGERAAWSASGIRKFEEGSPSGHNEGRRRVVSTFNAHKLPLAAIFTGCRFCIWLSNVVSAALQTGSVGGLIPGHNIAGHFKELTVMNKSLMNTWWILGLRGAIAIAFGALALSWPNLTLLSLVALFAAYALLGGIVSIAGAVKNRRSDENWSLLLLLGLVSVGAGVVSVIHPALTALVLVLLMGANALVSGVLDLAAAAKMRSAVRGSWLMLLNGIAGIVFGVLVFLYPGAGALAMVWLISIYALVAGAAMLIFAFQLRSMTRGKAGMTKDRRVIADRRMAGSHSHA